MKTETLSPWSWGGGGHVLQGDNPRISPPPQKHVLLILTQLEAEYVASKLE